MLARGICTEDPFTRKFRWRCATIQRSYTLGTMKRVQKAHRIVIFLHITQVYHISMALSTMNAHHQRSKTLLLYQVPLSSEFFEGF
jgi:hypothetical protein